jgi:hypothetical protein
MDSDDDIEDKVAQPKQTFAVPAPKQAATVMHSKVCFFKKSVSIAILYSFITILYVDIDI